MLPISDAYMLRSKPPPDLPCPALTACSPPTQNTLRKMGDQDSVPAIQNAIGQGTGVSKHAICPDLPCPALTVCRPRPQNMLRNIGDQDSVPAIQNAIGQAYVATNKEICMRMASSSEAGSCAVTFLVTRAAGALHLFIANAGDCRAVLCTGELTLRHLFGGRGGCVPDTKLSEVLAAVYLKNELLMNARLSGQSVLCLCSA